MSNYQTFLLYFSPLFLTGAYYDFNLSENFVLSYIVFICLLFFLIRYLKSLNWESEEFLTFFFGFFFLIFIFEKRLEENLKKFRPLWDRTVNWLGTDMDFVSSLFVTLIFCITLSQFTLVLLCEFGITLVINSFEFNLFVSEKITLWIRVLHPLILILIKVLFAQIKPSKIAISTTFTLAGQSKKFLFGLTSYNLEKNYIKMLEVSDTTDTMSIVYAGTFLGQDQLIHPCRFIELAAYDLSCFVLFYYIIFLVFFLCFLVSESHFLVRPNLGVFLGFFLIFFCPAFIIFIGLLFGVDASGLPGTLGIVFHSTLIGLVSGAYLFQNRP